MSAACKCGHSAATHVGGVGPCTDVKCPCDSYAPRPRVVGDEARKLADVVMGLGSGDDFMAKWYRACNALQDVIDQRVSWEREANKLLAQRDYADRRANEVEQRHAQLLEQLRAVLARFDSGGVR